MQAPTKTKALTWGSLALCWTLALCGCATHRREASTIKAASGATVTAWGPVESPANVATNASVTTLPIPAGLTVTVDPEPVGAWDAPAVDVRKPMTVALAAPSELRIETRGEVVTAPKGYAPPEPPTPAQLADGRAVWLYRIGLVVGIAAALFGLVRGWDFVMYGGGVVAAACSVGLFAHSHPVLFAVIGGGIALAGAGVFIWHTRLKAVDKPAPVSHT